jgi:hypothetical protein
MVARHFAYLLVFKVESIEKAQKLSSNLDGNLLINRDPSTYFYSSRNLAMQGEGKHQGEERRFPTSL